MDHTRASVLSVCTAAIKSRIAFSHTQRNHSSRLRHSPVASTLVIASCTCLISAVAHGEQRDKKRQAPDPAEWLAKNVAPLSTERIAELLEVDQSDWFNDPQWCVATPTDETSGAFIISAHTYRMDANGDYVDQSTPVAYYLPTYISTLPDYRHTMSEFIDPSELSIDPVEAGSLMQCTMCLDNPPVEGDMMAGTLTVSPTSVAGELITFDGESALIIGTLLEFEWSCEDGSCLDQETLFLPRFTADEPLIATELTYIRPWFEMRSLALSGEFGKTTAEEIDEAWTFGQNSQVQMSPSTCKKQRILCLDMVQDTFVTDVEACEKELGLWGQVKGIFTWSISAGIGCQTGANYVGRNGRGILQRLKGFKFIPGLLGAAAVTCWAAVDHYSATINCFDRAQRVRNFGVRQCNITYQSCENGLPQSAP